MSAENGYGAANGQDTRCRTATRIATRSSGAPFRKVLSRDFRASFLPDDDQETG